MRVLIRANGGMVEGGRGGVVLEIFLKKNERGMLITDPRVLALQNTPSSIL